MGGARFPQPNNIYGDDARIRFIWKEGHAHEVEIVDDH